MGSDLRPMRKTVQTKQFKDWTGHNVTVPVNPERVIYHGEVTGDLVALGVIPVGILRQEGMVFDDQVADATDVGFPISVEKVLGLNPDLIIFSNSDEAQYDQISKIAPTVTFNSFAPLEDRLRTLGDLLNKKQEAEEWIIANKKGAEDMWAASSEWFERRRDGIGIYDVSGKSSFCNGWSGTASAVIWQRWPEAYT